MKPIKQIIKLQIKVGDQNAASSLGTVLGPAGVNIGEFTNQFGAASKDRENGEVVPVILRVFEDRTFDITLKSATASYLLKKAASVQKGSGKNAIKKVGKVSEDDLEKIAKIKMEDLNARDIEDAKQIIKGTARSMGIEVS